MSEQSEIPHDLRVLQALRRIMRATELHSRQLSTQYQITTPQLVALAYLAGNSPLTMRHLAEGIHLSASTLVGIIDRLEAKGFVERQRGQQDRRQVFLEVTPAGNAFLEKAPSLLQDRLAEGLHSISSSEQAALARALERIVEFMEAGDIDAAPVLHGGAIQSGE